MWKLTYVQQCIATGHPEKVLIDYITPNPKWILSLFLWYLLVLNFTNLSWQSILLFGSLCGIHQSPGGMFYATLNKLFNKPLSFEISWCPKWHHTTVIICLYTEISDKFMLYTIFSALLSHMYPYLFHPYLNLHSFADICLCYLIVVC